MREPLANIYLKTTTIFLLIFSVSLFFVGCNNPDRESIKGSWLLTQMGDSAYPTEPNEDSSLFIIDNKQILWYRPVTDTLIENYIDFFKYDWITRDTILMRGFNPEMLREDTTLFIHADKFYVKIIKDSLILYNQDGTYLKFKKYSSRQPEITFDSLIYKTNLKSVDFMTFKKNK
jgi:hypothetical protein